MRIILFPLVAISGAAMAAPTGDRPANAAEVSHNTICAISDATGEFFITDCEARFVTKYDKDGTPLFQNYQDKAVLPADRVHPDKAIVRSLEWNGCYGQESITPSGHYRSTLRCDF